MLALFTTAGSSTVAPVRHLQARMAQAVSRPAAPDPAPTRPVETARLY